MQNHYLRRSNRVMAVWALLHIPALLLAMLMDPRQWEPWLVVLWAAMLLGGEFAFYYALYCYYRAKARPWWAVALFVAGLIVVALYWANFDGIRGMVR